MIAVGETVRVKSPHRFAGMSGVVKEIGRGNGRDGDKGKGAPILTVINELGLKMMVSPGAVEVLIDEEGSEDA